MKWNTKEIIIAVVVGLFFTAAIVVAFRFLPKNTDQPTANQPAEATAQEQKTEAIDLNNWLVYQNQELGFAFRYPDQARLIEDNDNGQGLRVKVEIKKLDDLDPAFVKDDQAALARGEFGEVLDSPVDASKLTASLGQQKFKLYTVLSRPDSCQPVFERKLQFYLNQRQITVSWLGDVQLISQSSPEYFTTENETCAGQLTWTDANGFYNSLAQRQGSVEARTWFELFEVMIQTVAIAPSNEEISNLTSKIGYIKEVVESGDQVVVMFDEVAWFDGQEAVDQLSAQGLCDDQSDNCNPDTAYYVRNDTQRYDEVAMVGQLSNLADFKALIDNQADAPKLFELRFDGQSLVAIREKALP